MCMPKVPSPPPVQPSPTRSSVQTTVNDQRRRLADQKGVTANIFTSALGDSSYGQSARRQNVAAYGQVA